MQITYASIPKTSPNRNPKAQKPKRPRPSGSPATVHSAKSRRTLHTGKKPKPWIPQKLFTKAGWIHKLNETLEPTGSKPKEIKVETFRIDYLIRTSKVEKLNLQPIRQSPIDPILVKGHQGQNGDDCCCWRRFCNCLLNWRISIGLRLTTILKQKAWILLPQQATGMKG